MTPETANVQSLSAAEKRALLAKMLRDKSARAKESFHPLSYMQRTLWAHYQLEPGSAAYSIPIVTRLHNRLDAPALARAVQALTARHAMLRTTYTVRDGRPAQHIHAEMAAEFTVHDARSASESELVARVQEEIQRAFDLEHGPMLRSAVYTRSETEHVVVLVVHHVAIDFWSLEILIEELPVLYAAELQGAAAALAPLTAEYTDYVTWQRELIAGPEGDRLCRYWTETLSGPLPLPDLPADHARPALQSYRGFTHFFKLDDELTRRLTALSRAEGATLYVTLLTVFEVLLHRYSGRDEIVVGAPTAGRNRPGFENVVGCFAEGVMLKSDLSGDLTFRMLLDRMRRRVGEALAHQDYPASLLVEKLGLPWDPSRSPMSQVMFGWDKPLRVVHRDRTREAEQAGWLDFEAMLVETFALAHRTTMFDLLMIGIDLGPSLYVLMQGSVALFDPESILRMSGHYRTLLEAVTRDPDAKIASLPLLTDAERHAIASWNATSVESPTARVHRMIEATARTTPLATALEFQGGLTTYADLDRESNRLAHGLRSLGVGPEVPVAIFVDRSPRMIVAALAVLKAGGAYVPLDPANPADRLASVLEDARPRVVLTERALAARLPAQLSKQGCETVLLDEEPFRFARASDASLDGDPHPDQLAYVIYTSGTTGRPKGVAVPHRGFANLVRWQISSLSLAAGERVVQFASFGFDTSVWEIFATLASGATLCLATRDELLPGEPLATWLERERITMATLPPAVLGVLPESEYPELRTVITAGDACSPRVVARWSKGRRLLNSYGPTEATVAATYADLEPGDRVPIGRPMSNITVQIVDRHGEARPVAVPGELCIGGIGVARGYVNDPRATAAKFVPDPSGRPGARMYRTGDEARFLGDGTIECLGRLDHQIKLRGYRIEPGEIEAVLRHVPGVRDVLILAREDARGEKRLIAYVVPSGARPPEVGAMRRALKRALPAYMTPSAFVTIEAFPRTALGKIDRDALPAPRRADAELRGAKRAHGQIHGHDVDPAEIERALSEHGSVRECVVVACSEANAESRLVAYVVPRTERAPMTAEIRAALAERLPEYKIPSVIALIDDLPLSANGDLDLDALPLPEWASGVAHAGARMAKGAVESRLAEIFAQVLELETVDVHESFFDLGGYSFLAAELIYRVRQEFGVHLVLSSLFETPTVASLARVVASGRDEATSPLVEISGPRTALAGGDLAHGAKAIDGANAVHVASSDHVTSAAHGARSDGTSVTHVASVAHGASVSHEAGAAHGTRVREPLFCFHPAGGQVLAYRHLAALLPPDRAICALQSRALARSTEEHATIAEMAIHYADVIRHRQPEGAYHLLGHSMGGVVAVAAADVLERDGREVAFVGLLDSFLIADDGKLPPFGALEFLPDLAAASANPAMASMSAVMADMDRSAMEGLMQKLLAPDSDIDLDEMLDMLESMKIPLPMSRDALGEHVRLFRKHVTLLSGYRPPVVRAPLHVWWAADNPIGAATTRADWRAHTTARVFEETVAGNHYSMVLPPRVDALAPKLCRALDAASLA